MIDTIEYSEEDRVVTRVSETHPKGQTKAVCVDVIDLGMVENIFKKDPKTGQPEKVRKIRIVWETARRKTDGRPFTISKSYKLSLYNGQNGGNSAKLYDHLSSWLGPDWNGRFKSEEIEGRAALLFIKHKADRNDPKKMIALVDAVDPDDSLDPYEPSIERPYKRFVAKDAAPHADDDDIGF